MQPTGNPDSKRAWLVRLAALSLVTGLVTACAQRTVESPDVVVVSPSTSPSPQVTPTTPVTPVPTAPSLTTTTSDPITDVTIIVDTPDQQSLANRRVQFTNVNVQNVVGDRSFWVGQGNSKVFVVLDTELDQGRAEEAIQVKPGQSLNLTGVLLPMPTSTQAQQQWQLSEAESRSLATQKLYLKADEIGFQRG